MGSSEGVGRRMKEIAQSRRSVLVNAASAFRGSSVVSLRRVPPYFIAIHAHEKKKNCSDYTTTIQSKCPCCK